MQVLVIIVQNAVPHSELGVATSGATFFRSIGGSFGTAIFGAIFSNLLVGNLATHLHGLTLPHGFQQRQRDAGAAGPPAHRRAPGFVAGYAQTIQTVFLCGADRRPGFPGHVADPAGRAAKQWPEAASAGTEAGTPEPLASRETLDPQVRPAALIPDHLSRPDPRGP